jgi:hypothetical protein
MGGIIAGPLSLSCDAGNMNLEGTWQIRKGDDASWANWPGDPDSTETVDYVVAFNKTATRPLGRRPLSVDGAAGPPQGALTLWYTRPAGQWVEALPVGNGRLGAMVFGDLNRERIQINEDTLWGGGPYDPSRDSALESLPEVRRLIFEGKYRDAAKLTDEKIVAIPRGQMP